VVKTYDLYIHRQGRWLLDSSYTERNDAVGQARRLEEAGTHDGVRVIEESFDEDVRTSTERTIHWSSKFLANPQEALIERRKRRLDAEAYRERVDKRVRDRILARYAEEREAMRRRTGPARIAIVAAFLFALWVLGALGLRYVFDYL
jgi:hypothetical protein